MRLKRITRQRNNTVYTGPVGKPMRMPPWKPRIVRTIIRRMVKLSGGPLAGFSVALDANGDRCTLPIIVRGQAGRYVKGEWQPHA